MNAHNLTKGTRFIVIADLKKQALKNVIRFLFFCMFNRIVLIYCYN